jgi:tRNA pseudouridine38-40 synthase
VANGVLLTIAYDGTAFHGWAAQKDARTVHEVVLGAIRAIDPRASEPRGASRTDAGVHAEGQLAAFDTEKTIAMRGWVLGINQHLPEDAAVRAARAVPEGFNPRFASQGKRYRYSLLLDQVRDPRHRDRAWRIGDAIDLDAMAKEAEAIVGTHDFAAFRSSADEREETVRTLTRVAIEREASDPRVVGIVVCGSAFLHNMVRIIAGTLVDVGRGRLEPGACARALASKERRLLGVTAPAQGLTLERVEVVRGHDETEDAWPR